MEEKSFCVLDRRTGALRHQERNVYSVPCGTIVVLQLEVSSVFAGENTVLLAAHSNEQDTVRGELSKLGHWSAELRLGVPGPWRL